LTESPPLRPGVSAIEKLTAQHHVTAFDCGRPELNSFLQRFALPSQQASSSQTYVACRGRHVAGYYSLAVGGVAWNEAPPRIGKGLARHPRGSHMYIFALSLFNFAIRLDHHYSDFASATESATFATGVLVTNAANVIYGRFGLQNRLWHSKCERFENSKGSGCRVLLSQPSSFPWFFQRLFYTHVVVMAVEVRAMNEEKEILNQIGRPKQKLPDLLTIGPNVVEKINDLRRLRLAIRAYHEGATSLRKARIVCEEHAKEWGIDVNLVDNWRRFQKAAFKSEQLFSFFFGTKVHLFTK
jgi:hypothetical protein